MTLLSAIGSIVIAVLLGLAAGFYQGDKHGKGVVQAKWDAQQVKDRKAIDDANIAAQAAAELYEEAKATQRTRTIVVTKEVTRALETAPAWRDAAVPDGVRASLAAASAEPAASQPDRAMPSTGAARGQDERGSGTGLRAGAGWLGRLSGAASGAR